MSISSINVCLTKIRGPTKFIRMTPSYETDKVEEVRIFNSSESNVAFKVDCSRHRLLVTMPQYGIIQPKSAFHLKIRLLKLKASNFDCKNDYVSIHMIVAPKEKTWKKPADLWASDSVLTQPMITYVIEVGYNKEIEGKWNESSNNNSQRLESGETTEEAVKKDTESETFQSTTSTTYYSALSGSESDSSIYYTARSGDSSDSSEDTASVEENGKQDEREKNAKEQCCKKYK
ncbi:hypothetical protein T4D_2519 [Trichinella pseudospiralis]|uniref:Major sperm protein n=1 Tax=Trichinella pseudospiralis TaxID=6337 RepID=A0A0V1F6C8_TRIPS|nr:hypothetical protein T4D_2519 [Trichinella pseudospiralis]